MKKRNYRTRRRWRNQQTKCAITLTVEALEMRLALSAVGFGFEGVGGQLDLHARDHGNRVAYRSAFTEKNHDERNDLRFDFSGRPTDRHDTNLDRFGFRSPKPDERPRGGPPHEPISARAFERGPREPHFDDHSAASVDSFDGEEGESTVSTYQFDDFSSYGSVVGIFEPNLFAEPSIPSMTLVFSSLTPTTSPPRGNDLLSFAPTTRLTQSPRTASTDSVSFQSSSTLGSSSASSQTPPTTLTFESPRIRFDSASSDSDAVLVQPASESARIAVPGSGVFVSLATNDLASWWNVDGESFETVFEPPDPLTESVRPSVAIEQAVASLTASSDNRRDRLSEESLWAGVSQGGFIAIDTETAESSRERFEFAEDSEDVSGSKRLSTQTPRDAFWFDLGDTRLDRILDLSAAEELAEEQALDDAGDTDEEAWLLDDGGMIVLASSQFIDQADEVAVDETSESPSIDETAAGETDVPMDAGIGVFQAIEVTAVPIEQQDAFQASENTPEPIEGEVTAEADDVIPAGKQAAKTTENGQSEPIRAASMPLLFAISALLSRGRNHRKKVANRRHKA